METVINGVDFGPLAALVGTWEGGKGMDKAPEPNGTEENPYYETILYEALGNAMNAGKQKLAVLRYHQIVSRKADQKVFHNETGYWSLDTGTGVVAHSLTIPRAVCVLAGGTATLEDSKAKFDVSAKLGDKDWGIIQSPFMRDNASTIAFEHHITVEGDTMTYNEITRLQIYGKAFDHTDENTLKRKK